MGKVGIYGSSFDPVTYVHLWTAATVAHRAKLDKVIFLPCASNRMDKQMKASDDDRWEMLRLAIEGNGIFEASDYEIKERAGTSKQYTWYTLEHFKAVYPEDDLYFIMGADLLEEMDHQETPVYKRWKYREKLIKHHRFIVMSRNGIDMPKVISKSPLLRKYDDGSRFHLIDKGLEMDVSSGYIQDELASGGEVRYLLPDSCYQYIIEHGLYRDR